MDRNLNPPKTTLKARPPSRLTDFYTKIQKKFSRSGAKNPKKGGARDLSHKSLMENKMLILEKICIVKEASSVPTQKWPRDLENTCALAPEWVIKALSGTR
jgi:hypothetical protein